MNWDWHFCCSLRLSWALRISRVELYLIFSGLPTETVVDYAGTGIYSSRWCRPSECCSEKHSTERTWNLGRFDPRYHDYRFWSFTSCMLSGGLSRHNWHHFNMRSFFLFGVSWLFTSSVRTVVGASHNSYFLRGQSQKWRRSLRSECWYSP